jgi:meiotically up-regulated gene 157 (Mug157) protein
MLGWCTATDPTYKATRSLILSKANPYFYAGAAASGIGSPHTPPDQVWPIALAVQGLTSDDPAEKRALLDLLLATDGGTGLIHESFHVDDPAKFTRPWFSWANAMFCELALDVAGLRSYRRPIRNSEAHS